MLERVANPHADTLYLARFTAPEFTSLCPVTGQPDFAHLVIDYAPGHHADFILINVDPLLASPAELRKAVVSETWVGGRPAYQNEAATAVQNEKDGERR